MDIIKNLRDLNCTEDMLEFMSYLRESMECDVVVEKINNKKYIKKYALPNNDLPLYNYAQPGAEARRLLQ